MIVILTTGVALAFTIALFGIIVLMSNRRVNYNCTFFSLSVVVSLWTLFYMISVLPYGSVLPLRLVEALGLIMAALLTRFSLNYPTNDFPRFTRIFSFLTIIILAILVPVAVLTPLIIESAEMVNEIAIPNSGGLSFLYQTVVYSYVILAAVLLAIKYQITYSQKRLEKRKLLFVIIGLALTAVMVTTVNLVLESLVPDITDKHWMIKALIPCSSVIFISFTSYGILKGGLFDIRLAIVRSATYSLLIATLAGIYAGTTFAISSIFEFGQSTPAQIISNAAISLILVFLFQPLRKFFDRITSRVFYKGNYSSDEFFGRLNNTLAITTDLQELLERASNEIATTLKSSHAFFYIFSGDGEKHISSGTANYTDISNETAASIKKYLTGGLKVVVALLLEEKEEIKKTLSENKIEIVLPLTKDEKTIGFLCLGENMSSNYTDRDIVVLDAISSGLVIAIQNALAVQEIRDFNITLRQRIDEATEELRVKNAMLKKLDKAKDEFVSMASHQLRTPLTSVKGYLSMVVDGDAGTVTDQQKDLLNQAYASNERMVTLVNDFLNVSRIQTGKFILDKAPIDLSKLVDEEVKGLVQNATKRQIKLDYKLPTNFPTIDIDEGKVRQVVMNFIDNAIYYSNVDSTIEIDLAIEDNKAIFTVKDTGIGVPASEQAGLFTKFYRASNAKKQRPDGTGVGLYLAKRIVTDHGGEIVFKTVEGKGSTFGFSLPVK